MRRIITLFLLLSVIIIFNQLIISCDGGLAPKPAEQKASISGTVIFKGGPATWPPKDSVIDLRVVAFKNYPPDSILKEITSGNAYFTQETLPFFVDSANYTIDITDAPVEIKYIAVAQRYDSTNFLAWRAIGVYTLTGDNTKPSSVLVEKGKPVTNVNITVDFQNLPPQPFH